MNGTRATSGLENVASLACSWGYQKFGYSVLYAVIQEGREVKETCISPLPRTKSRIHPGHPRGSWILEQDFVGYLLILESKRE